MIKIRLCSENPEVVEAAVTLFEQLFPDMRFSAVRLGGNPKYANDPKYFSYGEPRIRNKKPVDVDFNSVTKRLALPKATRNGKR
jgi:hypothetical protein